MNQRRTLDKLINTTPTASHDESNIAIVESGVIFVDSLNLVIPTAPSIEMIIATHIGYTFMKRPSAMPPKAICDKASPNKECRLKTKNNPTTEQITATATPAISAHFHKSKFNNFKYHDYNVLSLSF